MPALDALNHIVIFEQTAIACGRVLYALVAVQEDRGCSTLGFLKQSPSRTHDERVIENIAELPFQDFIVVQIQESGKIVDFFCLPSFPTSEHMGFSFFSTV